MSSPTAAEIADGFIRSLAEADHQRHPYDHWLLEACLPEPALQAVRALPFAPPSALPFDGRRESANSTRIFFSPDQQRRFPVCSSLAEAFASEAVAESLSRATGVPLEQGRLRIEYCQDVDGFWLEPHLDIAVKLFTLLIYLSDDPRLADAGTDIYDDTPVHRLVRTVPYRPNTGFLFVPGRSSWHGFRKRPIRGVRQSIIVNYVAPGWRAVEELC